MIRNIRNSEKLDLDIDAWKIQENDINSLIRISLNPDELVEPHINENTVIFYVLSGSGDLSINEQVLHLEAHDSIEVAGGIERGWTATGSSKLELLVVKFL